MNLLAQLFSPEVMRLIALSLLHFLWQGTGLAAIAYAGMLVSRTAQARYLIGVAMIVLMAAAPAATYLTLQEIEQPVSLSARSVDVEVSQKATGRILTAEATTIPQPEKALNYCFWLVELWFAGVIFFSVRSAGGVVLVEQLRRRKSKQVSGDLLALCLKLQRKLGLRRQVRFSECPRLDAPAVVGWLRPAILLPITALTGLSEQQLSSIIAHELAHIKRYDSFVNLFQVVVETFLFYHPAVWWLNKQIREERENCCDDMAVSVGGNPLAYAHALARMAELRTSPRLLMAANSQPLAARVARLLGRSNYGGAIRRADLSVGLLCLSASLLAGGASLGAARNVRAQQRGQSIAARAVVEISATAASKPVLNTAVSVAALPSPPAPPSEAKPAPRPDAVRISMPAPQSTGAQTSASSYIDGLKSAGLDNLTVDQLIALKIQGVTPEYVKDIRQLGLKVDADELVGMKIQGITPEYVHAMRDATGQQLNADELMSMKIQGVTPEFLKQMHELGLNANPEEIVGLKIQGVTPEYIQEMRKLDLKIDTDEVMGMKVQGVTPEYVRSIRALGLHPDADELIGMKVQGIDGDYIKKIQAAGFKLDPDDAISAKVAGITPEFIEKVRSHGFKDLSLQQLIGLKESGALDNAKE